jgi:PKD repeat protein
VNNVTGQNSTGIANDKTNTPFTVTADGAACVKVSSTTDPSNGGIVTILPSVTCYKVTDHVSLLATAQPGFSFQEWVVSNINLQTLTAPTTDGILLGDSLITARFRSTAEPPTARFDIEPLNPRSGESIRFSDLSSGSPSTWAWDFDGDGKTDSRTQSASFAYPTAGKFTARLTVTNAVASATTTKIVSVSSATSSLEFIDPNSDLLSGGGITTDMTRLIVGGRLVFGAATDGVTRVLLRSIVSGPGSVTFELATTSITNDGSIARVESPDGESTSITLPVTNTAGVFGAVVVYRVPSDFNMDSLHASASTRSINVTALFRPATGTIPPTARRTLYLLRPPLFLIHGLWSEIATWGMPLASDDRWPGNNLMRISYRNTNAASFSTNAPVVSKQLRDGIALVRRSFATPDGVGIAATQGDIVAHSMGGILARFAWEPRNDNYLRGDIHKLITLDTPHLGSDQASEIERFRHRLDPFSNPAYFVIAKAMEFAHHSITDGAVEDLATGSPNLRTLPATNIPSHAIVGVPPITAPCLTTIWKPAALLLPDLGTALDSDGLVSKHSQEGGLSDGAFDPPVRNNEGCHANFGILAGQPVIGSDLGWSNTTSRTYSERAVALLNTPVSEVQTFGRFPAPATFAKIIDRDVRVVHDGIERALSDSSDPIIHGRIHLVLSSTTAAAGTSLRVSVQSVVELRRVVYVAQDSAASSELGPSFVTDLAIPMAAFGELRVKVFAVGTGDTYFDSDEATITITSDVPPSELRISPAFVHLSFAGEARQLNVSAIFADAVWRDVSANSDTIYSSSTPSVVAITKSGEVLARNPGTSTVVVQYRGVTATISVQVDSAVGRHRAVVPPP